MTHSIDTLSTHVLDTSTGLPGAGITVILESYQDSKWVTLKELKTNTDGRIPAFFSHDSKDPFHDGTYRLTFQTRAYFLELSKESLYPYVVVCFEKKNTPTKHLHIPLLISPYGYSTYRGS